MRALHAVWKGWQTFWFEADAAVPLTVFRRVFALLALVFYSLRTPDLGLLFKEKMILLLSILNWLMRRMGGIQD